MTGTSAPMALDHGTSIPDGHAHDGDHAASAMATGADPATSDPATPYQDTAAAVDLQDPAATTATQAGA